MLPKPCLCLVTDSGFRPANQFFELIETALAAGVNLIQYREKSGLPDRLIYQQGLSLTRLCRRFRVPLVVNDRLDLAMAVEADGIHLGQNDLPVAVVRRLWPAGGLFGVSANRADLACQALAAGATYIGVGAVFATTTKADATGCSLDELQTIIQACPAGADQVMAIGGIGVKNLGQILATGCRNVAVASAVWTALEPAQTVKSLWSQLSDAWPKTANQP